MLVERIKAAYVEEFGEEPILVRSPGRINIIGEHTDYNEGFVLPAAIDRSIVTAVGKSGSDFSKAVALDPAESHEFDLNDLQPIEKGGWRNYVLGVISEIKKLGKEPGNFNLVFGGDIPVGAGLSSSAALENGIVFALNELFDLGFNRLEMVHISHRAENNFASVRCGIMDQYSTMFCEEGKALLLDCRSLQHELVDVAMEGHKIILIDTGVRHRLAESSYNTRRATCENAASLLKIESLRDATGASLARHRMELGEDAYQKGLYVVKENQRVVDAVNAIRENRIDDLGELLFRSHEGLKNQFKVSCQELDFLVDRARESAGVTGARMMGGGFGGCTINIMREESVRDLESTVSTDYEREFGRKCDFIQIGLSGGVSKV